MNVSRGIFVGAGLSHLIRDLREEMGLSQEGLARLLDISFKTVVRYEKGQFEPDPIILLRIMEVAPDRWKLKLIPYFPAEMARWMRTPAAEARARSRYSAETQQQAHDALDLLFARATSPIVEDIMRRLTRYAGQYADDSEPRRAGIAKTRPKGV